MPKLSPPMLGAQYTSALRMRRRLRRRRRPGRGSAGARPVSPASSRSSSSSPRPTISISMSGNRSTRRGQRAQQHGHALARFVEAAEEQHRLARPRVAVQSSAPTRTTRRRRRWGSRRHRSRAPPSASAAPGPTPRCGRRSSRASAAGSARNTLSVNDFVVDVWKVATIGPSAMFSASIDRLGALGSCRCSTSKSPSSEPLLDHAVRGGPEPQPRHRPVVRDRHGLAAGHHVVGQLDVRSRRRRQHADLVAAPVHHLGELQHVRLHPAGDVERVRADHADAHQVASELGAPLLGQVGQPLRLQHVPVGGMRGDVARRTGRPAPG